MAHEHTNQGNEPTNGRTELKSQSELFSQSSSRQRWSQRSQKPSFGRHNNPATKRHQSSWKQRDKDSTGDRNGDRDRDQERDQKRDRDIGQERNSGRELGRERDLPRERERAHGRERQTTNERDYHRDRTNHPRDPPKERYRADDRQHARAHESAESHRSKPPWRAGSNSKEGKDFGERDVTSSDNGPRVYDFRQIERSRDRLKEDKDLRIDRFSQHKGPARSSKFNFINKASTEEDRQKRTHDKGESGPRKRPFHERSLSSHAVAREGKASLPPIPTSSGTTANSHINRDDHGFRPSTTRNSHSHNDNKNKRKRRERDSYSYEPNETKRHQGKFNRDDHPSLSERLTLPESALNAPRTPEKAPYQPITMRTSTVYERVLQVGEGTYGKVYKARNVDTNVTAALKRLRMESEREGMPITAVREIKLLQSLRHSNIVSLREMMIEEGNIYMVFEYLDHDLAGLMSHPDLKMSQSHIKFIFKQMMEGLAYLHHKAILHRDIKGSNILLDNRGQVKIADFGLARSIDMSNPDAHYTNRVITLWYRPPELLLGATKYSSAIDVWSMGCLLIEMFRRKALFPGTDEISQLASIYSIMGTPTRNSWPEAHNLPWFQILYSNELYPNVFCETVQPLGITANCFDLAEKLLSLNPRSRLSAQQALAHPYFTEEPAPQELEIGDIGEWHDYEAKKRRRKEREEQRRKRE